MRSSSVRLAHFHLPDKYQDKNALMGCSMMPYLSSSCRNNQATIVYTPLRNHIRLTVHNLLAIIFYSHSYFLSQLMMDFNWDVNLSQNNQWCSGQMAVVVYKALSESDSWSSYYYFLVKT